MSHIHIFPDSETLSRAAADLFLEQAQRGGRRGRFSVALAGGESPRRTYELLARSPWLEKVPWDSVFIFWGDERCVPAEDPRSNRGLARRALLDHVPIPAPQVHPISCGDDPEEAACRYEGLLRAFFAGRALLFDLVLLGLGEDGHIASLFPEDPALETERWAAGVHKLGEEIDRITLTVPCFNRSAQIVFLVCGAGKARALRQVLEGPLDPFRWPAQLVQPEKGELHWLVDEAAAAELRETGREGRLVSQTTR